MQTVYSILFKLKEKKEGGKETRKKGGKERRKKRKGEWEGREKEGAERKRVWRHRREPGSVCPSGLCKKLAGSQGRCPAWASASLTLEELWTLGRVR